MSYLYFTCIAISWKFSLFAVFGIVFNKASKRWWLPRRFWRKALNFGWCKGCIELSRLARLYAVEVWWCWGETSKFLAFSLVFSLEYTLNTIFSRVRKINWDLLECLSSSSLSLLMSFEAFVMFVTSSFASILGSSIAWFNICKRRDCWARKCKGIYSIEMYCRCQ